MTILWLLDIDSHYGMRHGATLRYTNLSRGLMEAGHRVVYVLNNYPYTDRALRTQYLATLRDEGCFESYFELEPPPYPQPRAKLSGLLISPAARNRILRSARNPYTARFAALASELNADLCILSDRRELFLIPELSPRMATIVDWCDSATLYQAREIPRLLRSGQFGPLLSSLRIFATTALEESYYGRVAGANLVVSPVDKQYLDRLNACPDRNLVLPNGITLPQTAPATPVKDPNSIIFTGSMGYPPNYTGALWLIDHVLPLLIRRNPAIRVVIAGQEPAPELLAKAGPNVEVTGMVPDLGALIASCQLYVAPLFSGSGFRNKVVEALNSGTYVLGTPMALEFLDDRLRAALLSASTAETFSEQILAFLANPAAFDDRLRDALRIVREEYLWPARIRQFEAMCSALIHAPRTR